MKKKDMKKVLKQCEEIDLCFDTESEPTLDVVDELIHSRFDPSNIVEVWFDYGSLSDDGEIVEDYVSINGELFEFTLKLNVEWVGDWSVRANVATSFEVTGFSKVQETA